MVSRYKTVAVVTPYWKPGEDYLKQIVDHIENKIEDGDLVTISEKAISTALGNIVDESAVQPSSFARFLAKYWMHVAWGYVLGPLCRLRKKTVQRFRSYPLEEGSAHKQVALEHAGILQALMPGSEGGIDVSNLPYFYVSLPLRDASQIAEGIRGHIKSKLGKNLVVMIVDTDKTYSLRRFHFTPRPKPIKGIRSSGGFLAYVVGRSFKMNRRATPIAVAGSKMRVEEALEAAEIANRARGFGARVWDFKKLFGVSGFGDVTWEMLGRVEHKPIVILKR